MNFVEGLIEEEDRLKELQLGRGVRARNQPLVSGCLPEPEQLLRLQGPAGGHCGKEQQQQQQHAGGAGGAAETQEPEPGHLIF